MFSFLKTVFFGDHDLDYNLSEGRPQALSYQIRILGGWGKENGCRLWAQDCVNRMLNDVLDRLHHFEALYRVVGFSWSDLAVVVLIPKPGAEHLTPECQSLLSSVMRLGTTISSCATKSLLLAVEDLKPLFPGEVNEEFDRTSTQWITECLVDKLDGDSGYVATKEYIETLVATKGSVIVTHVGKCDERNLQGVLSWMLSNEKTEQSTDQNSSSSEDSEPSVIVLLDDTANRGSKLQTQKNPRLS